MLALTAVRPLDHFFGIHTYYPDIASGQGVAPFKTLADYENNLKRHHQYAAAVDKIIGRFREGMASGVVQPKLVVRNIVDQLDLQLKQGWKAPPFRARCRNSPKAFLPPIRRGCALLMRPLFGARSGRLMCACAIS